MNRHLKQLAGVGFAALLGGWSVSAMAADVSKSPEVEETGKLTVANTIDFAPFEYLDADGKPTGIIIELAGEVNQRTCTDAKCAQCTDNFLQQGVCAGLRGTLGTEHSLSPALLVTLASSPAMALSFPSFPRTIAVVANALARQFVPPVGYPAVRK